MNKVTLKGKIQDIQYSHNIGEVQYDKANLIVDGQSGSQSILSIKFKKYSNKYHQGDIVSLVGNLRSFSTPKQDGKNKVNIYVFTYMDEPQNPADGIEVINKVELDGRICKMSDVHKLYSGKSLQFILANNIQVDQNKRLNSYIPCIAYNELAEQIEKLSIGENIKIIGQFRSRQYKKKLEDGEIEIRVAHEVVIKSFEIVK